MSESRYNIFYTDDDSDDREVFKEIVEEINEEILIFTQETGQELLDLLKNPPPSPHVIFLDLNMPGKNGLEVLREMRVLNNMHDLPVVIFSTSADEDNIALTKQLGANLYVKKPNDYNQLKNILRHVLGIDWDTFRATSKDYFYN